jgi:hypothetical protein
LNRISRPNTWPHRPTLRREVFPCQLGAVHTWRMADTVPATMNVKQASRGRILGVDSDARKRNAPPLHPRSGRSSRHALQSKRDTILAFGLRQPAWTIGQAAWRSVSVKGLPERRRLFSLDAMLRAIFFEDHIHCVDDLLSPVLFAVNDDFVL